MKKSTKKVKETGKLHLNINRDDNNLNDFISAWEEFGSRPNRIILYNSYSSKDFNEFILSKSLDKNVFTEVIPSDEQNIINDRMFVKLSSGIFISYVVIDRNYENSRINEISFFYKSNEDSKKITELIDSLNSFVIGYEDDDNGDFRLHTLTFAPNGLEIDPITLKEGAGEFENFYSAATLKRIGRFLKSIKKAEKGISILWGEKGTGKTHFIHHLAQKIDKMFFYIPNNMIDQTINNPDFRKFFKKYPRAAIVIDDCEILTSEPFGRSNSFLGNLVQLVDDLISDDLQLNIIAIFNVERESEIEELIFDSNNIVEVVPFEKLTKEEADDLSHHLGFKKKWSESTRLIDVIKNRIQNTSKSELGF